MPKDKYPGLFSYQMEAIVFIVFQIFFATSADLKTGDIRQLRVSCIAYK